MKHKAKPSGSSGGSRLRLTILLATVAAFLLVPAAQAFAASGIVHIAGTGSGTVSSAGGTVTFPEASPTPAEGTPAIECSGFAPGSGTCTNTATIYEGFAPVLGVTATADPGSEFVGWTIESGTTEATAEECAALVCELYAFEEELDLEVTATFDCETEGGCEPPAEGPLLTVTKEGTGSGTVVSSPAGIECGATCSSTAFAAETEVTLTASPAAGSTFTSWKKCDTGKVEGRKCTVKMSVAKTVGAKFSPTYDVTVKKTTGNTGLGSISGVACDASCTSATAAFVVGKTATLKPKASKGSAFTEWSSCPGTVEGSNCVMTSAGTAEAKFTAIPKFSLTVNKTGFGQGTVKSKPSSISCGLTCSTQTSSFQEGTEVELTASVTAGKGSSFGGWIGGSGTCTGVTTPCKMPAITGTQSITAEFK